MTALSEIEKLAKESRNSAIRSATALFKLPEEHTTDLIEAMIDGIITAAMMEISAMQIKIVEEVREEQNE